MWDDRSGHAPSFTGYAHQLWAASMWSSLPWLSRIRAPTLVVVGDDDPLVPVSNALMIAARIPRARMVVAEGEGHFLLLDERSTALAAINEFVTAPVAEESEVWRTAAPPDRAGVAAQLRADGLGAQPWGVVSAFVRGVVGQ